MLNKNIIFTFLASIVLLSACKKAEKILPSGNGLWDLKKSRTIITEDGALVSDITLEYDSLGQLYFGEDGSAWSKFHDNDPQFPWVWEADDANDAILMYPEGYPDEVRPFPILELSKNDFVLQETTTNNNRFIESTMTLERAE